MEAKSALLPRTENRTDELQLDWFAALSLRFSFCRRRARTQQIVTVFHGIRFFAMGIGLAIVFVPSRIGRGTPTNYGRERQSLQRRKHWDEIKLPYWLCFSVSFLFFDKIGKLALAAARERACKCHRAWNFSSVGRLDPPHG